MITPTVGRIVWYRPGPRESIATPFNGDACAAIITYVHSDLCVNLAVFDPNGVPYSRTSVFLIQDGAEKPAYGYAEWMPYQKGQAAKTEALEAQLSEASK